ncbi:rrna-processing protein utp23 [Ophiostoma piceae UAMH 11346]|uniref:U three protein 23 n=1 Tax=Ophiostoma piceae (strain UAMH 11346) TaxID=1262450 RepID=S3C5T6_OPHP1|nr:rrna-processing protein utp23 [Ophiostoma piceae UAMH 11346]
MRAKRSKQYKKLVQQYQLHHGFREPYQVLVDGEIVRDAQRFTMDLQAGLERTLHGKVKIMITQCCIRHLYESPKEPGLNQAIDLAKTFERRRCGHRPEDFDKALTALDCLKHVVDEKGRGENKHRYVVATQDQNVRRFMRGVSGVPLIYINRSVMIMEPMSEMTAKVGASAEHAKFRSELRNKSGQKAGEKAGEKRKRGEDDGGDDASGDDSDDKSASASTGRTLGNKTDEKKKKGYGAKGPNPLSVKKKKAKPTAPSGDAAADPKTTPDDGEPKKKRKRKHKARPEGEADAADAADAAPAPAAPAAASEE